MVFVVAGMAHFAAPAMLEKMIPPYLPAAVALVLLSGVFELAGGAAMFLWPKLRRGAGWMLALMLASFLPANLHLAMHPAEAGFAGVPPALFWARVAALPFMMWALVWATRGQTGEPR
jgi:uncharacterized membrane protein